MQSVLILTSNVGGGHISSSQAIAQTIKKYSPNTQIIIKNTSIPGQAQIAQLLITSSIQTQVKTYHQTNNPKWVESFSKIYQTYAIPILSLAISQTNPDLIICTNSLSLLGIKPTLKKLQLNIPYIATIVDPFSIHHLWTYNKDAQKYLVPASETKKILIQRAIPSQKIAITGYPIRHSFLQRENPPNQTIKTILIGGSGGSDHVLFETAHLLGQNTGSLRLHKVFVVTGKNKRIRRQLEAIYGLHHPVVKIIGFTVRLDWYMSQADIVIGKPGPNFIFESIILQKPIVITGIPMGQEEGNAAFITANKIGLTCHNPSQLPDLIRSITPQKLATFHQNISQIRKLQLETPQKIWHELKPYLNKASRK